MRTVARLGTPIAAAILLTLLVALVGTGQWPGLRSMVAFAPNGLLSIAPADIRRVEIRSGTGHARFVRQPGGWGIDGTDQPVAADLAAHLATALRLINVSAPVREIPAAELSAESFAEFGLDPPALVADLETAAGAAATVNFGTLNPAGTSHYVRLGGTPAVYLTSRHVGDEWQLVLDMARRLTGGGDTADARRGGSLLLPLSLNLVWAIEIVFAGKLTRFERDAGGNWFRHVGQHVHAAGGTAHVADPVQARIIDTALRSLDATAVETHVGPADPARLDQCGLKYPALIVLSYARDSSTPVSQLEFGAMADRLDRFARLAPDGEIVTVAEFEARRLTELLKAVGAGS